MKNLGMRNRLVCVVGIMAALLGLAQAARATLVQTMTSTNMGAYTHYIYSFTTSINTQTVSGTWTVPAGVSSIDVLVVAGGGAGGGGADGDYGGGGGGGAGGLIYAAAYSVTPGATLPVQVGGGGVAVLDAVGGNGSNSIFATQIAIGGGGGGIIGASGRDGGSGGGAINTAGKGTTGQGHDGHVTNNNLGAGGGGGAGDYVAPSTLTGGEGLQFSQFASLGLGDPAYPGWFAGGGGGYSASPNYFRSYSSKGGGGYGAYYYTDPRLAASGAPGTGGGGGGGRNGDTLALSGNGGSGIVILAYDLPIPEPSTALLLALGGALVWRAGRRGRR